MDITDLLNRIEQEHPYQGSTREQSPLTLDAKWARIAQQCRDLHQQIFTGGDVASHAGIWDRICLTYARKLNELSPSDHTQTRLDDREDRIVRQASHQYLHNLDLLLKHTRIKQEEASQEYGLREEEYYTNTLSAIDAMANAEASKKRADQGVLEWERLHEQYTHAARAHESGLARQSVHCLLTLKRAVERWQRDEANHCLDVKRASRARNIAAALLERARTLTDFFDVLVMNLEEHQTLLNAAVETYNRWGNPTSIRDAISMNNTLHQQNRQLDSAYSKLLSTTTDTQNTLEALRPAVDHDGHINSAPRAARREAATLAYESIIDGLTPAGYADKHPDARKPSPPSPHTRALPPPYHQRPA